jgi:hypothetical protein
VISKIRRTWGRTRKEFGSDSTERVYLRNKRQELGEKETPRSKKEEGWKELKCEQL